MTLDDNTKGFNTGKDQQPDIDKSLLNDTIQALQQVAVQIHQIEYRHGWTAERERFILETMDKINQYLIPKKS